MQQLQPEGPDAYLRGLLAEAAFGKHIWGP